MTPARKKGRILTGAAGLTGVAAVACAACCVSIPLMSPLLAWLGVSILGAAATGWYLVAAGVFAIGMAVLLITRRARTTKPSAQDDGACACAPSCKL